MFAIDVLENKQSHGNLHCYSAANPFLPERHCSRKLQRNQLPWLTIVGPSRMAYW